jgi:serine/threonine protein kinase
MSTSTKIDINIPPRPNPVFNNISEFTLGEELGEGAIASVFYATHNASGNKYAIKDVDISSLSEQDFENVEKELEIHSKLQHPYIIKLVDFFKENSHVYIVLEYAENGNLFKYLTKNNPLDANEIGRFWTQTVKAIEHLHSRQILMRDLKPENLLLDKDMNIKVCDFGWATRMDDLEYKKLKGGTFAYMSPETLEGREQGTASDIWSLGILLFELHHNREPFTPGDSCEEQLYFLKIGRIVYKMGLDMVVSNIIEKLLKKEFEKRITIEKIFEDPYTKPFLAQLQNTPTPKPSSSMQKLVPSTSTMQRTASSTQQNGHTQNKQYLQPQSKKSIQRIPSSSSQRKVYADSIQKHTTYSNNMALKSNTSFTAQQNGLKENLLSYQPTMKSVNNISHSNLEQRSFTINQNAQEQQHLTRSHTSNLHTIKSTNKLVNQTSMGSHSKQAEINTIQNGLSFGENVQPEKLNQSRNNIKDIMNYYKDKNISGNSKTVNTLNPVQTRTVTNYPAKSFTNYRKTPVQATNTITSTSHQQAEPQNYIKYNQNGSTRVNKNITINHNRTGKTLITSKRNPHTKTYSMDPQSLQNTLNERNSQLPRMTEPQNLTTHTNQPSNHNVTPTSSVTRRIPNTNYQKLSSNPTTLKRDKSKNRIIKLADYKFMRASKLISGLSVGGFSRKEIVKAPAVTKKVVETSRGMTKNRSYNDLKTYQARLNNTSSYSMMSNQTPQKFNRTQTNNVIRKPMAANEYGMSVGSRQVNGGGHSGLTRQKSKRKINLATYHRSYNLLK